MYDYSKLPDYMQGGMQRYIEDGIDPGDFLFAVLSNNLSEAVQCADCTNIEKLPDYVMFMYWEIPSTAWGSKELVHQWIADGGLQGEKNGTKRQG